MFTAITANDHTIAFRSTSTNRRQLFYKLTFNASACRIAAASLSVVEAVVTYRPTSLARLFTPLTRNIWNTLNREPNGSDTRRFDNFLNVNFPLWNSLYNLLQLFLLRQSQRRVLLIHRQSSPLTTNELIAARHTKLRRVCARASIRPHCALPTTWYSSSLPSRVYYFTIYYYERSIVFHCRVVDVRYYIWPCTQHGHGR